VLFGAADLAALPALSNAPGRRLRVGRNETKLTEVLKRVRRSRVRAESLTRVLSLSLSTVLAQSKRARAARRVRWALLLVAAAFACTPALPEPTSAHVALAQRTEPSASLEDLQRGRTLYLRRCGTCHALRDPNAYDGDEWRAQIERMEKVHSVHLTTEEEADILRYLTTTGSTPSP
jgi:mono/diheme cytochrome c family protein